MRATRMATGTATAERPAVARRDARPRAVAETSRREAWSAGWFVVAASVLLLVALGGDLMYGDSLMNVYAGRYIWQHGVPATDPFTLSGEGRAWIDGQWLSNLSFYGASRVGGLALVGELSVASVASGFLLVSRYLRRGGASFAVQAFVPIGGLVVSLPGLFPRAETLVIPLFVALIRIVLDADRAPLLPLQREIRSIAALICLLVLWANLHGSSAMAVCLTCAFALRRCCSLLRRPSASSRHRLLAWGSLLLLAPATQLATPYGFGIFGQYRATLGNSAFRTYIDEWAPAWQLDGFVHAAPALLLAVVAATVALRRRRRLGVPLPACVGVLAIATVYESRYSVWLGISACVLLGEALTGTRAALQPRATPRLRLAVAGLALVATFGYGTQLLGAGDTRALQLMPTATVAAAYTTATRQPHTAVLGDLDSSVLMLWLHPDMRRRVEFDSRQEIFRPAALAHWYRFMRVQGAAWFSPAARDGIVMASSQWSTDLTDRLGRPRAGWRVVRTTDGVVLSRTPG